MAAEITRRWRLADLTEGMRQPTDDDVPTDRDGNRLDSPEKLREHLDRVNRERSQKSA